MGNTRQTLTLASVIVLAAVAVVVGGLVMVLDPIFQGLAVALISGAVVATLLTMIVVPLLYWELARRENTFEETTDEAAADHIQRVHVAAGA